MYVNRIRIMKFICFMYSVIWIINTVILFRDFYAETKVTVDPSILMQDIFVYWLGVLASLILPAGFVLVFWSSYRIRNGNERVFDCAGKKVLTFLIAITIFKLAFQVSIFFNAIFFTLVLFIRYLKHEQMEVNIDNKLLDI